MHTKRAVDWGSIGKLLLAPELIGAIVGGAGAPLATYLVRRNKEMPKWRRIAELLGAAVLGAGAGAGIGYGGKKLMSAFSPPPAIRPPDDKPTTMPEQDKQEKIEPGFNKPYVDKYLESVKRLLRELSSPYYDPDSYQNYVKEVGKLTSDLLWAGRYDPWTDEARAAAEYLHGELSKLRDEAVRGTRWEGIDRDLTDMLQDINTSTYHLERLIERLPQHEWDYFRSPAALFWLDWRLK